ncbi:hypothetical protein H8K24_06445 [Blautia massiliensis]|uniref:hypothetical protein n=1 Tax=Blautia massiliensis (ex Durand et al. 2017) TaxID=1737424 RepID=UPI001645BE39|nr:hypothetical protein [Blautia massiliensis (ex Durand et al. 2017)]MBC3533622.1 hypothetical protein [Blautia massiliensis (ex Durand et al. 2017)]
MRFQKEVNIFAPDAILKRFQANETNFSVVKGKIEALISESEILELQNSKVTMYSKLADVKLTVDGLEQTYTDITSKYDAVSGKYTDLDAKVAEYKSGVDGMSQNLSQVQTNLRDNYSTTATMNATIQAKIDGLSSTISQTYATGSDVQQKLASADATAKGYADAAKQAAIDTAQASTKELLKSYATVTKTQSMIDQKATSIESVVSATYATKKSVDELQTWKTEASLKITDSAILATVTKSTEWTKKADANTVSKLETRVKQTETDITSKVSKGSISSEINQTAQDVKISASKIDFNGLVTANKYFKINKDGSMEAISGKIGGWTIGSNTLKSVDSKITLDAKNGKIITAQDNSGRVTAIIPGNVSTGHIAAVVGHIGTSRSTVSYIKIVEEFSAGESKDHSSMCINGSFMADGESIKIYNAKHVTSGGHLVFGSDGSTVAYLSSSAKRYKNHLSNMTLDEAKKILDIPVVWFNYKEGYLAEDDQMNGKPVPGMYAEDVAKYYPVGAYNNEEGLVENWNERMIIPAMLKLLQNLYKRIS